MSSSERSSDILFRQISSEKKPQGYEKKHKSPVWRDVSSKSPEKIQGVVSIIKPKPKSKPKSKLKPIWEYKKLIKIFNKEMPFLRDGKGSRKSKTNNEAGRRGRKTRKTRRHKNQKKSRTYKK